VFSTIRSRNVAGGRDDNSFYSPGTSTLSFGTGGVDDAEDAEIILHEYGHAIQDAQVPGWGEVEEAMAMGEGFGDYFAASFFAEVKPAAMRPTVGNWDATFYSAENPPALRRLDSNKKYPKDLTSDEHDNGELWSASLWQLRAAVGRHVADRLAIAHHFLLNRRALRGRRQRAAHGRQAALSIQPCRGDSADFRCPRILAQPQAQAAARGTALRSVNRSRRRVSPSSACGIRARRCRRRASAT
jgi:hypothetical protein